MSDLNQSAVHNILPLPLTNANSFEPNSFSLKPVAVNKPNDLLQNRNSYIAEIEQAFRQKMLIEQQLLNPNLEPELRKKLNQQFSDLKNYLAGIFTQPEDFNLQNEQNLKLLQNSNRALQNQIISLQNELRSKQVQTGMDVNRLYSSSSEDLKTKIVQNTANITNLPPSTLQGYLHLAFDYLVQNRLPKLLSTRLWLVIGGGYLVDQLGSDNVIKLISIIILIVIYIISEMFVKSSKNFGSDLQDLLVHKAR